MKLDKRAWLVDGTRTPFGKFCGDLREMTTVQLGTDAVTKLIERNSIPSTDVDELYVGVGMIEGGASVPARQIGFLAELPETVPTLTVDRACCSGMTAMGLGAKAIASGANRVVTLGVESMSNTPRLLTESRWSNKGDAAITDPLFIRSPLAGGSPIARYTGERALDYGIGREEQDEWAAQSHQRYFDSYNAGYYADEIFSIVGRNGSSRTIDEPPRPDTNVAKLQGLPTVYGSPTVTPGNAPGLNDGAVALMVCSDSGLDGSARQPLARVAHYIQIAGPPTSAVYLPGLAIRQLLDESGMSLSDIDVIEINEAFAATPLVSLHVLARDDAGLEKELRQKTNAHGGAVAMGHPIGASGARIALTAARRLSRGEGRWAIAAICGGFGQTDAVLLESAAQ